MLINEIRYIYVIGRVDDFFYEQTIQLQNTSYVLVHEENIK